MARHSPTPASVGLRQSMPRLSATTLLTALLVALAPATAQAAPGNSTTLSGTINATVVAPLVLTHWAGYTLNFGTFQPGSGGTVTVSPAGVGSTGGGVTFVTGSTVGTDRLIASGDPNRLISISTAGGTVSTGLASMSFTTTPNLTAGFLPAAGAGYFTVGGTLTVSGTQLPGTYVGSYLVTVTYN